MRQSGDGDGLRQHEIFVRRRARGRRAAQVEADRRVGKGTGHPTSENARGVNFPSGVLLRGRRLTNASNTRGVLGREAAAGVDDIDLTRVGLLAHGAR